jgi:2-aminobenzoate-CoA ligase
MSRAPAGTPAHVDSFTRDNLPPPTQWPVLDFTGPPALDYPGQLNCATALLDERIAAGDGGRTVFVTPQGKWSYQRLFEESNRIARVLAEDLAMEPGARVLLRGPNNPQMVACWFGVLKAGGVVVCTMPLLRARELRFVVDKARVSIALCDGRFNDELSAAVANCNPAPRILTFTPDGTGSLDALVRGRNTTFADVKTAADETALIAFTSGTTGQAKGTMHFHRDVLAICDCFPRHILKADRDELFCGSPPFAFTFGLGGLVLFPMRIGAASLLLEQAAPPMLIKGIEEFRANVCFTAPTAYRAMLGLIGQHDVSSLARCVSAGEHLPLATFEAWKKATGISIIDGIGTTEMLHIFISASGDDVRPGSTGRAVPGYTARVVDGAGKAVPNGSIGRLAVRGPTGCRYLANEERQLSYVQDGWNITGDAYVMDDDGYFWYQARSDDMIISAGHNISGPEVENVLLEHEAVQECGVVGVPDEERGQVVKAFVVLKPGFQASDELVRQLQEHVKSQIAPFKYPRKVEFVERMPRTETGKLQRFRLREGSA